MFYVPWWYGIGAGAMVRYEIPIVPDGFIPAINDQFSLEPALGFAWQRNYDDYCRYAGVDCGAMGERGIITPAVYGVWSFHITSRFRPYAALGLGVDIGIDSDDDWHYKNQSNFFFDSAVGLFYRFAAPVGLRAEIGSGGPKVGLAFYL